MSKLNLINRISKMRISILSLFILIPIFVSCSTQAWQTYVYGKSNFYTAYRVGGYWSKWHKEYFNLYDPETYRSNSIAYGINRSLQNGGGSDYFIFDKGEIPSKNYFLRIHIDNYRQDQDAFNGYVEYYVSDEYPTAEKLFEKIYYHIQRGETSGGGLNFFPRVKGNAQYPHTVKRKANATIKIVRRYKAGRNLNEPSIINCWFDNVGFGLDLSVVSWKS